MQACLEFAKKKYTEARDLFKTALKGNPNGPYQMRLGLAICYLQIDEHDLARLGFNSVLRRVVCRSSRKAIVSKR